MAQDQETYRLAFPDHSNPPYTKVSYGLPFLEACGKHVTGLFNAQRAYVIASTSLSKQTSHVTNLEKALGARHAGTWVGIRPHTPWDDLVPIINDMRAKDADLLITLGGGSLTDGAKIIVYALANNVKTSEDIDAMIAKTQHTSASSKSDSSNNSNQRDNFVDRSDTGNPPSVRIVCIPTTLSAGEYSKFGGGTSSITHEKTVMTHPLMFPSLVILDPSLTVTTPAQIWLSTGIRAVDHCVESFCSPIAPPEVEEAAIRSLKLLIPGLLHTKSHPKDLQARLDCMLAANYILVNLLWAPDQLFVGASHGIGHQLGPLGVGHGETSCILLPAVMKYNHRVNGDRQDRLKHILWSCGGEEVRNLLENRLDESTSDAADALDVVIRALGMPRSLAEVGVAGEEKLSVIARNSIRDPCCRANPIPLETEEMVREILEMVK